MRHGNFPLVTEFFRARAPDGDFRVRTPRRSSSGAPLVDDAVAIVVDLVAADLWRARIDAGVVVSTVIAPDDAVTVIVGACLRRLAFQPARDVIGALLYAASGKGHRPFEVPGDEASPSAHG